MLIMFAVSAASPVLRADEKSRCPPFIFGAFKTCGQCLANGKFAWLKTGSFASLQVGGKLSWLA